MMNINILFAVELKKILEEEIERIKDVLSTGTPVDYAEYKQHVGRLQGMRSVIDYCDEVQTKISNR
jgi:hypothetical protein